MALLRLPFAGAVVATAALVSCVARAEVVSIVNASFETAPTGGFIGDAHGPYSVAGAPGWTSVSALGAVDTQWGVWQPDGVWSGRATDGSNILYANGYPVTQILSIKAIAGVTYTMSFDIGYGSRKNNNGAAELWIGPLRHAGVSTIPIRQESNLWYSETVVYKATDADNGKSMLISLNPGNLNSGQALFDNIRLTDDYVAPRSAAGVPEPAAWALMALGFGATGIGLRRRQKTARA